MEVCIKVTRHARMCFDTEKVRQILNECMKEKTLDECLRQTGWERYRDLLVQHGVIEGGSGGRVEPSASAPRREY